LQGASKNKFTGNEYDDDLGLNLGYHIDRYYDHMIGRWGVPDPVLQYSLSPYVYGANNPLIIVDPFGADTMYVDWPGGKRTAQYIPDIVVEAPRLFDPRLGPSSAGYAESPLLEVDDLVGGVKFLAKEGAKIGAGVLMATLIKKGSKETVEKLVTKANSKIWKLLKPYRGKTKTNGLPGKKRQYYEWDHTHNDIEVYDSVGKHLGTMDPSKGEIIKPAVPGRKIDL
jgi:RHS repeat-associated protein